MGRGEFVLPLTTELGRVLAPGREILVRCGPCMEYTSTCMQNISLYCLLYIYTLVGQKLGLLSF